MILQFSMPLCRVYFNRASDAPRVWSIDGGAGTPEITAEAVLLEEASGVTRYHSQEGDGTGPQGSDVKMPRAWIEFRDVGVEMRKGAIVIRGRA